LEYWSKQLQIIFLFSIISSFRYSVFSSPLLQYSITPFFFHIPTTSHINVIMAVATMIETILVTTAEVAA
jgi:hypothetical protein